MKKGLTILLLLVYSLSVFGIGLKGMYCCGKLKVVIIAADVTEKQRCNKDGAHTGCCKTKCFFLKVKENHLTTTATLVLPKPLNEIHPIPPLQQPSLFNISNKATVIRYHAPPLHNGVPIHIFNCIYRI